jgi:hypothetical protein
MTIGTETSGYKEAARLAAEATRPTVCNCRRQDDSAPWGGHELWCTIELAEEESETENA